MRIAFKMFWYPVQRQVFPAMALRICCSVGLLFLLSRCSVERSSPGVQNPHCSPWHSAKAFCTGCSAPSRASPSTVVISLPSAIGANSVQDFTVRPFSSTVQAPQYVVSQPMWVPVRFKFSRKKSTSSVRGSTNASRASPFTRTRTVTISAPDIFVSRLDAFAPRAPGRDSNSAFHQRPHQRTFIIGRAAHVALRFGGFPRSFGHSLNRLPIDLLPAQLVLRPLCANRHQSHATQHHANVFANILAIHRELHRRTRGRIHRRAAFKRQVRSATISRRFLHCNFAHQLLMPQNSCKSVLDKIFQLDRPRAFRTSTRNRSLQRQQRSSPVTVRIGFRQRPANRPLIAHLHIRNSRRAIVQNRNCCHRLRHFYIRMTRQRSEAQLAIVALNPAQPFNEIDVHQRRGPRHSHLHQWNQALPAGQHASLLA